MAHESKVTTLWDDPRAINKSVDFTDKHEVQFIKSRDGDTYIKMKYTDKDGVEYFRFIDFNAVADLLKNPNSNWYNMGKGL